MNNKFFVKYLIVPIVVRIVNKNKIESINLSVSPSVFIILNLTSSDYSVTTLKVYTD